VSPLTSRRRFLTERYIDERCQRVQRGSPSALFDFIGRGSWIRTNDLQYPKLPRYQAALYPDFSGGPMLTFASLLGGHFCECWHQRTTSKLFDLVEVWICRPHKGLAAGRQRTSNSLHWVPRCRYTLGCEAARRQARVSRPRRCRVIHRLVHNADFSASAALASRFRGGFRPPSCPWSPARTAPGRIARAGARPFRSAGASPYAQKCPRFPHRK
jgi:hypothetical protein